MPPAWKTFDEHTATALKGRVDEGSVLVESITQPLFTGGDSVVIAPTLQKGAALVIIARRKMAPVDVEEPVQFAPLIEEIAVPQPSNEPPVELAPEPIEAPEREVTEPPPAEAHPAPDFAFGPTTWERVDEAEIPAEFASPERETRGADPQIWDLPSQAPAQGPAQEVVQEQSQSPASTRWEEEHYVATGFLGLGDYREDEQEIARAKRPWWKRIFSD